MPILIVLGLLLAFWLYIIWDRKHPIKPLDRKQMVNGWTPSPILKGRFLLGLSLASASITLNEWLNPDHPPFTGRNVHLKAVLYENFGPHGIPIAWGIITIAIAIVAALIWQPKQASSFK